MEPTRRSVAAQLSWVIESRSIELSLTELGGMMAPVLFFRDSRNPVQPYYVSPWQEEKPAPGEPVLIPLRGDFFCMPFGADNAYRAENHVVHGEPATASWTFESYARGQGRTLFTAGMKTRQRPGQVTKRILLKDNQNVVYTQHELSGYSGKTSLGHHATLNPGMEPGGMLISTSPVEFGLARPMPPNYTLEGEYLSLDGSKPFRSMQKVPTIWKDPATVDIGIFPAREGYCDIVGLVSKGARAAATSRRPAWTTAVFPGGKYLWFALKNASLLPLTLFWMENRGRHGAPWSGRNVCIGLEDVCGYLAEGLAPSLKKNPLSEAGVPTAVKLSPAKPVRINYIQGVTRVPAGFDRVQKVAFAPGVARFTAQSGKVAEAAVDWDFLFSGAME
ncbi:MAG: hypothetical protein EA384_10615 [Spirochaetaceae bacterium]|nr:MAG: hypothetical protein EA384_10615 [Spirochaetaceae bacterium]